MTKTPKEHLRKLLSIFATKASFPRDLLEVEGDPGYQHMKNDNIKYILLRVSLITILETCYDMMNLLLEIFQW